MFKDLADKIKNGKVREISREELDKYFMAVGNTPIKMIAKEVGEALAGVIDRWFWEVLAERHRDYRIGMDVDEP